eukprot:6123905-Amphidinium_carterae.1
MHAVRDEMCSRPYATFVFGGGDGPRASLLDECLYNGVRHKRPTFIRCLNLKFMGVDAIEACRRQPAR